MRTIKIFIASSSELKEDRKAFETFLYQKSKVWLHDRNIFLELRNWEDFIDTVSKTRLQDEYSKAIEECDIFVMLFFTKVGIYTNEEFETAWREFKRIGKPVIYTYFKTTADHNQKEGSLLTFTDKLKNIGHFPTLINNTEGFLLHFSSQLEKIYNLKGPGEVQVACSKKLTKTQLIELINTGDLFNIFEELNSFFLSKNDALNALIAEYINQPNNFNPAQFTTRLKLFVSRNW